MYTALFYCTSTIQKNKYVQHHSPIPSCAAIFESFVPFLHWLYFGFKKPFNLYEQNWIRLRHFFIQWLTANDSCLYLSLSSFLSNKKNLQIEMKEWYYTRCVLYKDYHRKWCYNCVYVYVCVRERECVCVCVYYSITFYIVISISIEHDTIGLASPHLLLFCYWCFPLYQSNRSIFWNPFCVREGICNLQFSNLIIGFVLFGNDLIANMSIYEMIMISYRL